MDRRPERRRPGVSVSSGSMAAAGQDVQERLRSEEGRAVIDEVVQERDEVRREKRSERFRKMGELKRVRLVADLVDEHGLDTDQEAQVMEALETAGEARSELWRKMRGDDEADPADLLDARERIRSQLETELTEVIGEDAATRALEQMRGPF